MKINFENNASNGGISGHGENENHHQQWHGAERKKMKENISK